LDGREHEGGLEDDLPAGKRVSGRTKTGNGRTMAGRRNGALLLAGLGAAGLVAWLSSHPAAEKDLPPLEARGSAYVPNGQCAGCHPAEAEAWAASDHFRAMAPASDASVLGDFGGVEFEHGGVTSRFSRRDGTFVVRTDGSDGRLADFDVAYAFGVHPLQQYLIAQPGGRLQALTIAWDTERRRWFHLYPGEKTPPGDVLHWTGRYQTWNGMCASCHSTNLRKNYDVRADRYRTTWSEINVSCQSCHGPGTLHVSSGGARVGLAHLGRSEVDACAACHARRSELTAAPVPGEPLYDHYLPALLTPDLYHADGQQLGEVYEYGSFRQSRMYQAGVRCTDCHDPHRLSLAAEGNALCVRCHQEAPDRARFPGLRAKSYESPAHHFHSGDSAGALCVSCHMPARTYMVVDPRHDHSIRVPRPDLTVRIGTPNACSGCHADRTAEWAAATVARWYGRARAHEPHYGEALAAGRAGRPDAEEKLVRLVGNAAAPAIVRATAVDLLQRYGPGSVPASVAATRDDDPAVRAAAVRSLHRVAPEERIPLITPLLGDHARAVRIEAARVLSGVPREWFDAAERRAYEVAFGEFVAAQNESLDMPGAHLNLAVVCENEGKHALAEEHYARALRIDPDFTPARLNLSRLLNGVGRNAAAETVLKEGIVRIPDQGELHYSLGLLLAEEDRLDEALNAFSRAAERMPERARVRYNYALALQQLGRRREAEAAFLKAQKLDSGDAAIAYALTVFYAQGNDWARARAAAEHLARLAPDDPGAQGLIERIRGQAP
jgi:predicted CXXCH cytochrome family protein